VTFWLQGLLLVKIEESPIPCPVLVQRTNFPIHVTSPLHLCCYSGTDLH